MRSHPNLSPIYGGVRSIMLVRRPPGEIGGHGPHGPPPGSRLAVSLPAGAGRRRCRAGTSSTSSVSSPGWSATTAAPSAATPSQPPGGPGGPRGCPSLDAPARRGGGGPLPLAERVPIFALRHCASAPSFLKPCLLCALRVLNPPQPKRTPIPPERITANMASAQAISVWGDTCARWGEGIQAGCPIFGPMPTPCPGGAPV